MEIDLGILPFRDFWVDCFFNTKLSVLCAFQPSYKYAACLNDYHYKIMSHRASRNQPVDFLAIDLMKVVGEKYIDRMISLKPFYFKDKQHYLKEIRQFLLQKKMLILGVDMFYWIPNSFCFEKYHWSHYSFINGFDDQKGIFRVFDDNLEGFGAHEIPEERFCKAFESLEHNPHGFLIQVPQHIPPFQLTLNEVLVYARALSKELAKVKAESLLPFNAPDLTNSEWLELFSKFVAQVVNRQTANILLFNYLGELNLIADQTTMVHLSQSAADLKINWQTLRKQIMKSNLLDSNPLNQAEFYRKCNRLFEKEHTMWKILVELSKNISFSNGKLNLAALSRFTFDIWKRGK